jgi:hypothetical protein
MPPTGCYQALLAEALVCVDKVTVFEERPVQPVARSPRSAATKLCRRGLFLARGV